MGMTETAAGQLYDTAVLVNAAGAVVLTHRKVNIVCRPQCRYTPGAGVSTAPTPWGLIGVLICADTFNETLVGELAARRPDFVVVPYGFQAAPAANTLNGQQLVQRVAETAARTRAPTVGVNNVGSVGVGNTTAHFPLRNTYCGWSNWANASGDTRAIAADRDVDLPVWTVQTLAPGPKQPGYAAPFWA